MFALDYVEIDGDGAQDDGNAANDRCYDQHGGSGSVGTVFGHRTPGLGNDHGHFGGVSWNCGDHGR